MKKSALILLFALLAVTTWAQTSNIRFDRISIEGGLSQSSVNTILQDTKGFIWIGTQDGLNIYDGYKFKVLYHNPTDSTSLANNFVHALVQDKKGNIWVGTDNGLCLFNKRDKNFKQINYTKNCKGPVSRKVIALICDAKNNLWVGTEGGGAYFLEITQGPKEINFKSTQYYYESDKNKLSSNNVKCIYEDENKDIWIGTEDGGLNKVARKTNVLTVYSEELGLSSNNINCIYQDSTDLIIGTAAGMDIVSLRFNTIIQRENISLIYFLKNKKVKCLYKDKDLVWWVGTEDDGLIKYYEKNNRLNNYRTQLSNPNSLSNNDVFSLYEDRSGCMWVGTNSGLNKFDRIKQNFVHYQHYSDNDNCLSSDIVWSIFEDRKGIVWIGTDIGVDRLDRANGTFIHVDVVPQGEERNTSIYSLGDINGVIVAGSDDGLYAIDPATLKISRFFKDAAFDLSKGKRIYSTFNDKQNIWMGTKEGLLVYEGFKKEFLLLQNNPNDSTSLSSDNIRAVHQDTKGNVWVGTNGGGLCKLLVKPDKQTGRPMYFFERYMVDPAIKNNINSNVVIAIEDDGDKGLWIGTFGGGLNYLSFKTKKFDYFTEKDGLSNNVVYGIVKDDNGNLWLSTNKGVSRFDVNSRTFQNYFEKDGLQSNEFNTGAYGKGRNGEIFFGGIKGFNFFFPSRFKQNLIPPTLAFTSFQLFNKEVVPGKKSVLKQDISETSEIFLSFQQNIFSIEFSALHFSNPENNQYAYMLEGLDEDWNYVGNRTIAPYTKIEPGEYVFKVKAANSDGVWTKEPLTLKITIKPPYWKAWWFRIVVFFGTALILFLAYKTRINLIKEQKRYLELQIRERTEKIWQQKEEIEHKNSLLAVEKDKVEKLLLNILPTEMVDELKNKGKASARHYRLASVMFTDFKDFTKTAEKMRPQELVQELDYYFIKFDEIIARYNIEKIKTIGDAYMAAGGVPIRNKSNPIDLILAGMEIQRFIEQTKSERIASGQMYFDCRIGINTGELIAGVVGTKRFAYDVWGDTVNIAARVEATGEVGKVNIGGATWRYAKEFFVCTYRGKVEAKNKGEIDMYFVERIRPELSADEAGLVPNEHFNDRLEHVLYSKINYKKAEHHIIKLLSAALPPGLFYHGLHHTLDVCNAVEEIALSEGIDGEDLHILKSAALFHDAGFTQQYTANEPIGCEMARKTLPEFGYSEKQIQMVERLILATQVPQKANDILEMIICDADLDYLGRDDFHAIADTLKQELISHGKITSDRQWDEIQVKFLTAQKYFTNTNKKRRDPKKARHLKEIEARLAAMDKGERDNNV